MLENTRIFAKVVQHGSFSKAASLMKMPKSTVSRAVRSLEDHAGTKLLLRTTRSIALTAAGRAFYETCLGPLQILEDAQKSIRGQDTLIAGTVKMTAPEDLGAHVISPVVARLCLRHPQLNFEIIYSNEMVDLVKDGYDLAIRIGKLPPSSFKVKRIGTVSLILVASPQYLDKRSEIRVPDDLKNHDALTLTLAKIAPRWTLKSGKKTATVAIQPRILTNQMTTLVRMAIEGAGIALVPKYLCQNSIDRGELLRVLHDWHQDQFPVSIVSPIATEKSARLKTCVDRLSVDIKSALES